MTQTNNRLVGRRLLLWCFVLPAVTTEVIALSQESQFFSPLKGLAAAAPDGNSDAHSLAINKPSGRGPPGSATFHALPVSPLLQGGRTLRGGERQSSLFGSIGQIAEPSSVMLLLLHTMAGGSAMLIVMVFAATAVVLGISFNRRPCCCCTPRL